MNISSYDLCYTVIKKRNEKEYLSDEFWRWFNDNIKRNHYTGK